MKTTRGWVVRLWSAKGEPVDTRGPYLRKDSAQAAGNELVGQKIGRLKVKRFDTVHRKTVPFSALRNLSAMDSYGGAFEVGGIRQNWVGFGLVASGPARGDEIVVVAG